MKAQLHVLRYALVAISLLLLQCRKERDVDPAPLGFGAPRVYSAHREIDVGYQSKDGSVLSGTLYLPLADTLFPAVIFHFGSDRWVRASYGFPYLNLWLSKGFAVLSYDKRGVGKSQGDCCDWKDSDWFPLLAADVMSGFALIKTHPNINPKKIGLYGFSQGGWVLPYAATNFADKPAFTIIGSGPVVTLGEELSFSALSGDGQCKPSGLSLDQVEAEMDKRGPSGFDPLPYIAQMTCPGLWMYGENDTSIPVRRSIANLMAIKKSGNKDFTAHLIPNVNHCWVTGGAMCECIALPGQDTFFEVMYDWVKTRI